MTSGSPARGCLTTRLAVMERVYHDKRRLKRAAASLVDLLFPQRAVAGRRR